MHMIQNMHCNSKHMSLCFCILIGYLSLNRALQTTYRKNYNLEKCAGMGPNGFLFKNKNKIKYKWDKKILGAV